MNRETLKTIAGLVIIAAIVTATFLYGNAQRQAQLKRETAKKTATATPAASQGASPAPASGSNTAPVKSPAPNAVQGGQATKPPTTGGSGQVAGASITPSPSVVPVTGGSGTNLPSTGAPEAGVIGLGAVILAGAWLWRSNRSVLAAARNKR